MPAKRGRILLRHLLRVSGEIICIDFIVLGVASFDLACAMVAKVVCVDVRRAGVVMV